MNCDCGKAEQNEKSKIEELTIYTVNGATFQFADVTIGWDNADVLAFTYISAIDGALKTATMYKDNMVGASIRQK